MIRTVIDKIFGTKSERDLKKIQHYVDEANRLASQIEALSDEQLKAKTQEFKNDLANGKTLDDILAPAFAVVREAAKRVIGLRPYDVQLLGGIVLHQGKIAEMGTGEGKTLVAVLPSYLNALTGKGVHVVTVNDYLARRDRQWMGPIHEFLGLTVGYINHDTLSLPIQITTVSFIPLLLTAFRKIPRRGGIRRENRFFIKCCISCTI